MRIVIIVDNSANESLLRFTETKLYFDAKNQNRDFFDNSYTVTSRTQARNLISDLVFDCDSDTAFIIETGFFLGTKFANHYSNHRGIVEIYEDNPYIIKYDPDTYIGFKKKCKYQPGTKQLYIVENMLRAILNAKKTIYISNTEDLVVPENISNIKHLCGLASGWKTSHLAKAIGLENLESITVFDFNDWQLDHATRLHSSRTLPTKISYSNAVGEYKIPDWSIDWWDKWHQYPVKFEKIDLMLAPKFPPNSLIWVSNVFKFEPTIFQYGWAKVKAAKNQLINANKESIIIETQHNI